MSPADRTTARVVIAGSGLAGLALPTLTSWERLRLLARLRVVSWG